MNLINNLIIPYQAITGNNNPSIDDSTLPIIIPYQAITGNNNCFDDENCESAIIPYQAITGNNNNSRNTFYYY